LGLGRPIHIQEDGSGRGRQIDQAMMGRMRKAMASAAPPSEVDVESGSILLTAGVTVTFTLASTL